MQTIARAAASILLIGVLVFLAGCRNGDQSEAQSEVAPNAVEPHQSSTDADRPQETSVDAETSAGSAPAAAEQAERPERTWPGALVGAAAPEMAGRLTDGERWLLSDARGTPILIVMVSDCDGCSEALRRVQELQSALGTDDFSLIAIVAVDTEDGAAALIRSTAWQPPALWDEGATITRRYAPQQLSEPAFFLLDAGSTVRRIWRQTPSTTDIEEALADLNRSLDLGGVTIHSDRPDWEVRQIAEGIAAVAAYGDHLGLPRPAVARVYSYADPFDAYGRFMAAGMPAWFDSWLLSGYENDPTIEAAPQIWLARADRTLAATAYAKSYFYSDRRAGDVNEFHHIIMGGLTTQFAYYALEYARYGSVANMLATATAAWRESGWAWTEGTIREALSPTSTIDTSLDGMSWLLDGGSQAAGPYTVRLVGVHALEWLELSPIEVLNHFHGRTTSLPPQGSTKRTTRPRADRLSAAIRFNLAAFEVWLYETGVIPESTPTLTITMQNADTGGQQIELLAWCLRTHPGGVPWWIRGDEYRDSRPNCHEVAISADAVGSVAIPAGAYDLLMQVDGEPAFVGAFGVTPMGIREALPDGILPAFDLEIDGFTLVFEQVPIWSRIEIDGRDGRPARWDYLCMTNERTSWCWSWDRPEEGVRRPVYAMPDGRYLLFTATWPTTLSATVELSGGTLSVIKTLDSGIRVTAENDTEPRRLVIQMN